MKSIDKIKIIFCDIDGTLVNNEREITEKTKESIKKITEKGILFVLVSGRDSFHTIKRSKDANASNYVITSNGAFIYDYKNQNIIYINEIDPKKVSQIAKACEEKQVGLLVRSLSGRYTNAYITGLDETTDQNILIDDKTDFNSIHPIQMLFICNDMYKLLEVRDLALSLDLAITNYSRSFLEENPGKYSFDINNKEISKGAAITKLLEYLNISKEESLCFGDFVNDIDMFNACGIKVAMQNASSELKEISDFITESNEQDGVAVFLDKYL